MKIAIRTLVFLAFGWLAAVPLVAQETAKPSEEEAFAIGVEAYVFGYPLVTMETTRQAMTNVPAPQGNHAPMGQFANIRQYPDPKFKQVTAPNADTLYSVAWLDLAKEPYVLHVPEVGRRYYLLPMLSGWTDVFASPGTRTTGDKAANFLIAGPNWTGTAPEGIKETFKAPTNMVWVLGRTYCTGTLEDYKAVHKIQDRYALTPLSAFGKPYTPPTDVPVDPAIDTKTPPRDQVNAMDAGTFFKKLALLMKGNPPTAADEPIIKKMALVGIVPGEEFDLSKLDPAIAKGLDRASKAGLEKIVSKTQDAGKKVNGWDITFTGNYGTDYLFRAAVAFIGLGANLPQDACYPMACVDTEGKPLNGANLYTMHFAKGQMPPVNGFWSLTMYDKDYFFAANPLNRYTLSQRNKLAVNADGSIDLYIQHTTPGKILESNWLPAPEGDFHLCLRLYWPKDAFLDGTWKPPGVKRVGLP